MNPYTLEIIKLKEKVKILTEMVINCQKEIEENKKDDRNNYIKSDKNLFYYITSFSLGILLYKFIKKI
jgi:FtsZ-binding cell division protein ZapB